MQGFVFKGGSGIGLEEKVTGINLDGTFHNSEEDKDPPGPFRAPS